MIYKDQVKPLIDSIIALILICILMPLLVFLAFLVKLDGGPIIFTHIRVGRYGNSIKVYKFRTMKCKADKILQKLLLENRDIQEEWYSTFKLEKDPRITFCGKFLRVTKLDELPQLINILNGTMSLIGPRPIVEEEYDLFFKSEKDKEKYQSVFPGITGLWQCSENVTTYQKRIKLELYYIDNLSPLLDLKIFLKTLKHLIKQLFKFKE